MAVTKDSTPSTQQLENNTFISFGDLDASPTKAWLIEHRHESEWKQHYAWAFENDHLKNCMWLPMIRIKFTMWLVN